MTKALVSHPDGKVELAVGQARILMEPVAALAIAQLIARHAFAADPSLGRDQRYWALGAALADAAAVPAPTPEDA